ncbi:MAG: methionyl-tRNA formyltransferase [Flavobacteriia bacterium]|nr:methionyl-tRNA formyltransferase [Flavobacteriia bacterium]
MKIVFMGTPTFAVGILDKLVKEKCEIVAVVTVADKPTGRGQKISFSAVKEYALLHNLPILQPLNLKDDVFVSELKKLNADLFVVVAFRMLPEIIWIMPSKGTINLHASLLPQYRGAAPINWAIINGDKETGVSTFFIEKEIDTGDILFKETVVIDENETAGVLHDKLMELGKELVFKSVLQIKNGKINPIKQNELTLNTPLRLAPKLNKENTKINWNKNVDEIHNLCRGLSPYPSAWTCIENIENGQTKILKIFQTEKTKLKCENVILENKNELLFPCKNYYLRIKECQLEGKKRMETKEFLAGFSFKKWKISEN